MSESPSVKALPDRPNLNWLKNRAAEQLQLLRAADPVAKLADAQLAVAREYGFQSWRKLKEAVEARRLELDRSEKLPAPDEKGREVLLNRFRGAISRGEVPEVRRQLESDTFIRASVNEPIFSFDSQPIIQAKNNPAMVDLLLEFGADINARSQWWAGPWGILDTVDEETGEFLIRRGAKVDIFAAANLNKLERLRELLDADPSLVHAKGGDGCRPLHFAKSEAAIDLLLDRGAEIDVRDVDHESTAAQWAVPRPPRQRRGAEITRGLDRVRWLLDRGATPDIFMAAALDDMPTLKSILDARPAALDYRVGGKDYPQCPEAPGRHIYVYTLAENKTPMQVAVDFAGENCLKLILSRASAKQRFLYGCSVADEAVVKSVLAQSPDMISTLSPADQRTLPSAAFNGDAAAVKLMLDLGFDPLTPGNDTGTALHCAAWRGSAQIVEMILNHPAAKKLGEKLVNAIETTHGGRPLGWCCHGSTMCRNPQGDYPKTAKLLLAAGAAGANLEQASPEVRKVVEDASRPA